MPIYEYHCLDKGHEFESIQKISDAPIEVCPECGGKAEKVVSQTSFRLKGSDWYVTDYKKKASSKTTSDNDKSSASNADSGTTKTPETSPPKKTED